LKENGHEDTTGMHGVPDRLAADAHLGRRVALRVVRREVPRASARTGYGVAARAEGKVT